MSTSDPLPLASTTSTGGGCCGHASPAADYTDAETATCPVMVGTVVVKADAEAAGLVREHDGQTYWLCCASCGPLFDAEPERYAS